MARPLGPRATGAAWAASAWTSVALELPATSQFPAQPARVKSACWQGCASRQGACSCFHHRACLHSGQALVLVVQGQPRWGLTAPVPGQWSVGSADSASAPSLGWARSPCTSARLSSPAGVCRLRHRDACSTRIQSAGRPLQMGWHISQRAAAHRVGGHVDLGLLILGGRGGALPPPALGGPAALGRGRQRVPSLLHARLSDSAPCQAPGRLSLAGPSWRACT